MMKRNSREKIPINLLEIVFVVGVLSKFISNSSKKHSEVVNIILRYLSGTKDVWVVVMYLLLDTQTLTMLDVLTVGSLLQSIVFNQWEVPYLGDVVSKNVLHCLPLKQSISQLLRHVRKLYCLSWLACDIALPQVVPSWAYVNLFLDCFVIVILSLA